MARFIELNFVEAAPTGVVEKIIHIDPAAIFYFERDTIMVDGNRTLTITRVQAVKQGCLASLTVRETPDVIQSKVEKALEVVRQTTVLMMEPSIMKKEGP